MIRSLLALSVLLASSNLAYAQTGQLGSDSLLLHEPYAPPITAAKIRTAIDDAVMYLRANQAPDGSFDGGGYDGGGTALAALAMLAAGADPASDDQLRSALDWLSKQEPNNTYVRGIRANVWEYALRKAPYDERIRKLLEDDFQWLLAALGDREGWRYNMQSRDWDNSCTQYGVLGVWAATRAGLDPGAKFWATMSKHFRDCQNPDGGWGYTAGSGSSANMATAGLASMFLVFDMSHGRSFYSADNPRAFASGEAAEVLVSIERGMNWLGGAEGNKADGYYLYGIERTGVAGGRKYIGGEDWFLEGAETVLAFQRADGSIPLGSYGGPSISTSFCTLFLVYGGAPVAIEKLQYGEGHDWNLNPRDLANLSKELWSAYERPINWQTVSLDSRFEAPILFLNGSEPVEFDEEQTLRLRQYLERGGTILAEPADGSPAFAESIERLVRQMFPQPDYPNYRLEQLPDDHGVLTVLPQEWRRRPRLRGVSDGSRTFLLLSDEYMSADWQMNRTESDAFKLMMNLLFYATDLGSPQGKFASILPDSPPAEPREDVLRVARLQYACDQQAPRDWNAAVQVWPELGAYARHVTGCELKEGPPVRLDRNEPDDALESVQLLHITGRIRLTLSDSEAAALLAYVEGGGTLLVDAYAGSAEFAARARTTLEAVFGPLQPLPPEHLLAEGRFSGGVDLSSGVRFKLAARRELRSRGESTSGQKLLVAMSGRRPAVLFSEFDLASSAIGIENYRSAGYKPDSARKILGNLLAYLMVD